MNGATVRVPMLKTPEPNVESWRGRVTSVPVDWYTTKPAPRTYLLRDSRRDGAGFLPLGRVGQIIAEGGAGKSMLACQLAVSVTTGTRWLGAFDVATQGRTLMLMGEEDADEVQRRLFRARRAMRAPVPEAGAIVVHALAGTPVAMLEGAATGNWTDTTYLKELREWIKDNGPWALVVVDPLSRFAGADAETDNAAATRFIVALESIATSTGATAMNLHHTNKTGRQGGEVTAHAGRGSSALVDGVRWQASMGVERLTIDDVEARERLGEIVVLSHTKANYSRKAEPVHLRRDNENGGALVPLDADDLEIVAAARASVANLRTKAKAKESVRAEILADREARETDRKDRKAHAKALREEEKRRTEDAALLDCLRSQPVSTGQLPAALSVILGTCCRDTAARIAARAVAGGTVDVFRPDGAPANARFYRLLCVRGVAENPPVPTTASAESGKPFGAESGKRKAKSGKRKASAGSASEGSEE